MRVPGLSGFFNIAAARPFVDDLARFLLSQYGDDHLALAKVRILVPNRRAVRAMADALLRQTNGRSLLLPRITPLGDVDEDELQLVAASSEMAVADDERFYGPPPIDPLRRRLKLTRLVGKVYPEQSPVQHMLLAQELGKLLDQIHIENLDVAALEKLAPDQYAEHWQEILKVLRLITQVWPEILAEQGWSDLVLHRRLKLERLADFWQSNPPTDPIIAAGSTGTMPATAQLLSVIGRLPKGMVILPGIDLSMADEVWQQLDPCHPQYVFSQLLPKLKLGRHEIVELPGAADHSTNGDRLKWLQHVLLPAPATDIWPHVPLPPEDIWQNFGLITCRNQRQEANVIALLMREALQVPGRTAALVTPDRLLAQLVMVVLKRWSIEVDDSAGQPLKQTPVGAISQLTLNAVTSGFAPVELLSLLQHPLVTLGLERRQVLHVARWLDQYLLRGPRKPEGLTYLIEKVRALEKKPEGVLDLLEKFDSATQKLCHFLQQKAVSVPDLVQTHLALLQEISGHSPVLFSGSAGEALSELIESLIQQGDELGPIEGRDYPSLFDQWLCEAVVRPRFGQHPRLFIWGTVEARMQLADVMILGGLNEGTWPPAVHEDPWMSRSMRQQFGLPPLDRRIGQSAHDFVQAACGPRVILTRSEKREGVPQLAARWLMRMQALLRKSGYLLENQLFHYRDWADQLDGHGTHPQPCLAPLPNPPVSIRPKKLSVTHIETWIHNPFALYAKQILGLRQWDELDADPGLSERGTHIHKALETFVRAFPESLPDRDIAIAKLQEHARAAFGDLLLMPGVWAFWWPLIERLTVWAIDFEAEWRSHSRMALVEAKGSMELVTPDSRLFKLEARADRIDRRKDGSGFVLMDYKTGQIPKVSEVKSGASPQLPLEALIAIHGGFKELTDLQLADLVYVGLSGSAREPGKHISLAKEIGDLSPLVEDARIGLCRLIDQYANPDQVYRPNFEANSKRGLEYAHLARVGEWIVEGDEP